MATANSTGYFRSGLPYNRFGTGPRILVIFQGLVFDNKPMPRWMAASFSGFGFLAQDYTIYLVTRKPGLAHGYSMKDMAADYATMIREEFGAPVDAAGTSTGGSIVQHFAADHPDLVRKVIIHSAAHTLGKAGKTLQLQLADLARERRWRKAYDAIFSFLVPHSGIGRYALRLMFWLSAFVIARLPSMTPKDPSDLIITIEAEDQHAFQGRLSEISAPTLVIAGDQDPFYSEALFRETAAGIPNARLILYPKMGHPAGGKQFQADVRAFLLDGAPSP